jgi:C1A family cysteine protease
LLGAYVLPPSIDWREQGMVNPPRQQSGCGACWTFASSSALASAWGIVSKQMVNLSQQQLLDCAGEEYGNAGCTGGAFDGTYRWAQAAPLCTAVSYPYVAAERSCRQDCEVGVPRGAVRGYMNVEIGSEAALMDAVTKQPVTVGIMVEEQGPGLKLYQGGIFSGDCTSQPNHAVVVVGYGTADGQDYWLIQNSWGPTWGEGGYFRLARGSGPDSMGECGILRMPAYPVVDLIADASTVATTTVGEEFHSTEEPESAARSIDFLV